MTLFRPGHNEFGLRGEITINSRQLARLPLGAILPWLAHAVLHAWQHEHGRPPEKADWHNKEYRAKAAEIGLVVAENGTTGVQRGGPFALLVTSCGIALEWQATAGRIDVYSDGLRAPTGTQVRPKGNSKLKKWICDCSPPVNVRVAIAEFQALCLRCNSRFHLEESASSGPQEADR
ncbi:hypothetical protein [Anatilimnocola floriformis]|uniref:hypothetical protein n=1 Tax=Anatilimnocola floriformis TaxID=2948575 RepID=UPI0020C4C488|nr:hypothetical protein [Anatilimnocola floriformis]